MSLFLGPIHHLMQARFLYTDAQTEALIDMARREHFVSEDAVKALDEAWPAAQNEPLENIIDATNIHGWLSAAVEGAESRFAKACELILDGHPERLEQMEQALETLGEDTAFPELQDAEEAWQYLQRRLLDGMPCDFPFQVTEESPEKVTWIVRACPHERFYGGDSALFYTLRTALVKGLLSRSEALTYGRAADGSFAVTKG